MAKIRLTNFPGPDAVDGFITGVQFVNDSAVTIADFGDDWVLIDDREADDDETRPYVPGV